MDRSRWRFNLYFDLYSYGTINSNYEGRILGDATGEMGPFSLKDYGTGNRLISSWYADEAWFVNREWAWFVRGGSFSYISGISSGIFAFYYGSGYLYENCTFRVVLSP